MIRPSQQDARYVAYIVLLRVADGAYSDLALDSELKRSALDQRDRRFVTELVYGVLRLRGRIDFALGCFCNQPLPRLQSEVQWLLRLGAYQLLEMDRVPAHAAVDATVELARKLGLASLTGILNGVLRALDRGRDEIPWPQPQQIRPYLERVCSLPTWLAKEVMRLLPNQQARALGEALAQPARQSVRVNTLKTDRDSFLDLLCAAGHEARRCTFAPEGVVLERRGEQRLQGDEEGLYQVQDEASMLIAHLLDAQPGQRILDACAAPGGKTTHLAALTANQAEIVAVDKSPQRVELIEQGARRLGCNRISAHVWDMTLAADFLIPESFDRVLLDAPCSGIGVLRRNPEGRWNKTAADLRQLAALQQRLLAQTATLVRPGGLLLYSVCSFSHIESNDVIDSFIAEHPNFTLDPLPAQLPAHWASVFAPAGTLRTYPHCHEGMDAFFAARLRRRA
ncbi:16S rRNA (cytosine(967)-C(5))-methyltransferase RsmB [Pelovirga terrestris]|uniref:16S rRNA (cytosine(967)-C(5))-methyltransferase n=1 Tax=Pelovirga terrestris TaxID=2771352 RepID=A0A8J6UH16_9BACT|nr:16S rRNA (cytosine(967)-C(5))-methyltransferase RsmB [Pelovirga terrestris]MBD1400783.1 16S rRNA (cytosine(967)-C(5))-methyltransferase RsmB [Pelovirga terrestris]